MKFFFGIFILFLFLYGYSYLNFVPLGYDSGIYLYIFKHFPNLPQWLLLGFSPGLFIVFYPVIFAGLNPESILIPVSVIGQIALFFSIYFVSRKLLSEKIALITTFLFSTSLIQFRSFWSFYVKNSFSLAVLILLLYFLAKKKLYWSIILGVLLGLFHLPTFLIFFVVIFTLLVLDRRNIIFYLKVLSITLVFNAFYYFPVFSQTITPFLKPLATSIAPYALATGSKTGGSGTFYELPISFLLTAFYLPFSFIGFYISRKREDLKPFLIGVISLLLMVITGFFFSRRYFIPLDLFFIFFAGIGLNFVMEKYKNQKDVFSFYFGVLILFIFVFILKTGQPLITKDVFGEIKNFKETKGYVLSTSKEDNAWLLGYTKLSLIAWAFGGEDKYWKEKEWQSFFQPIPTEKKLALLNRLPKPLYIFINDKQIVYLNDITANPCLEQLTPHFYKYSCK